MNRAVRDELLRVLSAFSDHAPDIRFGQLRAPAGSEARADAEARAVAAILGRGGHFDVGLERFSVRGGRLVRTRPT